MNCTEVREKINLYALGARAGALSPEEWAGVEEHLRGEPHECHALLDEARAALGMLEHLREPVDHALLASKARILASPRPFRVTCPEMRDLAGEYVFGALPPEDRGACEEHLREPEPHACRHAISVAERLREDLSRLPEPVRTGPRTFATLREEQRRQLEALDSLLGGAGDAAPSGEARPDRRARAMTCREMEDLAFGFAFGALRPPRREECEAHLGEPGPHGCRDALAEAERVAGRVSGGGGPGGSGR